jgi:hypothetical protein
MDALENNWICVKKSIHQTIDEGHVECDGEYNRFRAKYSEWSAEIGGD